jgi:hypothetical protein
MHPPFWTIPAPAARSRILLIKYSFYALYDMMMYIKVFFMSRYDA